MITTGRDCGVAEWIKSCKVHAYKKYAYACDCYIVSTRLINTVRYEVENFNTFLLHNEIVNYIKQNLSSV